MSNKRVCALLIAVVSVSALFHVIFYVTYKEHRSAWRLLMRSENGLQNGIGADKLKCVQKPDIIYNTAGHIERNTGSSQDSIPGRSTERVPNDQMLKELRKRLEQATKRKTILLWYPHEEVGMSSKLNTTECGNCKITTDRHMINDSTTAAVLFHSSKISMESLPPPNHRNLEQLHIFWSVEPTSIVRYIDKRDFKFEDNYGFNATLTYREDSDFCGSYKLWLRTIKLNKTIVSDPQSILAMKSRLGAAVVSNCRYTAGAKLRMEILKRMKDAGSEFDGFGRCFEQRQSGDLAHRSWGGLLEKLKGYKFFFAFENSYHCKDYITEKIFRNAYHGYAIPIVFGAKREDYENLVPKGSFIYVEDFPSVQSLVEYIAYLDKNDTAYLEYFRWHRDHHDDRNDRRAFKVCQICRAVHGINYDDIFNPKRSLSRPLFSSEMSRRTVSLQRYMYGEENKECLERDLNKLNIQFLHR